MTAPRAPSTATTTLRVHAFRVRLQLTPPHSQQQLWFAAKELYASASKDLAGAYGEGRVELSQVLRQRAEGVDTARERFQLATEDRASFAVEAKLRDPQGQKADVEGRTPSHLAILLTEVCGGGYAWLPTPPPQTKVLRLLLTHAAQPQLRLTLSHP